MTPRSIPPAIEAGGVVANPHNVLSAIATARVRDADSVAVRFGRSGSALETITPAFVAQSETVVVPVLGLLPETPYTLQVVAYGGGHVVAGDALAFTTGSLPADLPTYVTTGSNPSPGYVVLAAGPYGLVIDNQGRVVWYHRFPQGPGLNFQAQPNGRYVARPPAPDPATGTWIELDPLGNATRLLGCAEGLSPRFHDLLVDVDGAYWIMCDETRTIDLSPFGGASDALVIGTTIQHLDPHGTLTFQWSVFDHFDIADLDPAELSASVVNWTHGNALDLDTDGNVVVSFRNLSEVTKIDSRTGEVLWRLGGARNQFAFEDGAGSGFARQHGLRVTDPGQYLLLDNLGDAAASRAERYTLDASARTVRLTDAFGANPPVVAYLGGTTQNLPGGRTLVSFGNGARVEEYDASGTVVWRIENPGYAFRAQRIESLYR